MADETFAAIQYCLAQTRWEYPMQLLESSAVSYLGVRFAFSASKCLRL